MSEITQKQKVINRLREVGYVDNFWAIQNYMLRLGAIIHDLTKEGWIFAERSFGDGKEKKNYYYYVTNDPGLQTKDYRGLSENTRKFLEEWGPKPTPVPEQKKTESKQAELF